MFKFKVRLHSSDCCDGSNLIFNLINMPKICWEFCCIILFIIKLEWSEEGYHMWGNN